MDKRHLLSVLGLFLALVIATGTDDTGTHTEGESSTLDIHAAVSFTGSTLVTTNEDDFDWTNVKLEINPHILSNGYVFNTDRIASHRTYSFDVMEFADSDGERFNPFTHKPQEVCISCDAPRGKKGLYCGKWRD
jgi:hypothetical protein